MEERVSVGEGQWMRGSVEESVFQPIEEQPKPCDRGMLPAH